MKKSSKKSQKYNILSNKSVAEDHFELKIEAKWLAKNALPGQFVQVKVREGGTDPLLPIPLGIHKIEKDGISVLYKVVGAGTRILSGKRKGQEVTVLGPLGKGFDIKEVTGKKNKQAILIAGGHGIAPLYALADKIIKKRGSVEVYSGTCERKHILCEKELKKLGAKVHIATECGTVGHKGYVTDLVAKQLAEVLDHSSTVSIYACGPRPMLSAVAAFARKNNITAQTSLDAYMACGIGVCLGCAVATVNGYKYVCKDGPVFDSQEVMWDKEGAC